MLLSRVIYLTFPLLLFASFLFAQPNVLDQRINELKQSGFDFQERPLFVVRPAVKNPQNELERTQTNLNIVPKELEKIVRHQPEYIRLSLPYNGQSMSLSLFKVNILADGFAVVSGNQERQPYEPGVYYRGIIEGREGSAVTVSFFENDVVGIISHPSVGDLNLGQIHVPGNQADYVLCDGRLIPGLNMGDCHVKDDEGESLPPDPHHGHQADIPGCVQIYIEADYELYSNKGSSISTTANYITGFFAHIATIYSIETISIAISQIYIWSTPDSYSTASSLEMLNDFSSFRQNFEGDLAHLISYGGASLGGVANLDVLCSTTNNYGVSGVELTYSYPNYSNTVYVMTHELGHNFGSRHTHWCGWSGGPIDNCGPTAGYPYENGPCGPAPTPGTNAGTIMSYCHLTVGITLSNAFGTQPGNQIRSRVNSAVANGCVVSSCPSSSCSAPTNITFTDITATTAIVNWNSISGATGYTLQYRLVDNSAWTTANPTTNTYTITGLTANTLYEVQVRAVCGSNNSPYTVGVIFLTDPSPCAEPGNLTATQINSTTANVNWTENGTATSWQIQYGLTGFSLGSGTTLSVSSHPYSVGGLTQGQTYDFYVRAMCGGSLGNSNWVGPLTYIHPFSNDNASGAILLTVNDPCTGNAYNNLGATLQSGELNPVAANGGYWDTNADNTVWFKFEAPLSGTVKITTDYSAQGTLNDTEIALYDSPPPHSSTNLLVSNEDGGIYGAGWNTVCSYSGLTPGQTYYIQLDGWFTSTGSFCIEVQESAELPAPTSCTAYTQTVNGTTAPNKWFNIYTKPNSTDIGDLVAAVKTGSNLGTVTVNLIRESTVKSAPNGVKYLQRYYNFSSTSNSAGAKQVRLFFTDTEYNNYVAATGMSGNTANDLNISHYDGTNENCTPNDNTTSSGATVITNVTAEPIGVSGLFYLEFQSPGFSEMGAIFGLAPLPVELKRFNGYIFGKHNRLEWETAEENDAEYFVVEYSPTGTDQWHNVCTITAKNLPCAYQCLDENVADDRYYRLAIVSRDGAVQYAPIVWVDRPTLEGIVEIVPNPALDQVWLSYQSEKESTVMIRIVGQDGKLLLSQSLDLIPGLNMLPFDIAELPVGMYFITAGGDARRFIKR